MRSVVCAWANKEIQFQCRKNVDPPQTKTIYIYIWCHVRGNDRREGVQDTLGLEEVLFFLYILFVLGSAQECKFKTHPKKSPSHKKLFDGAMLVRGRVPDIRGEGDSRKNGFGGSIRKCCRFALISQGIQTQNLQNLELRGHLKNGDFFQIIF